MRTLIAATAGVCLGLLAAPQAEAASVATDITVTVDGVAAPAGLSEVLADLLGVALGAEATGSTRLEPGSTGVIGDPNNIEGFIGAQAGFTLAGTNGGPVFDIFVVEDFGGVFSGPIGDITDDGASLSVFPNSLTTQLSVTIAGSSGGNIPFLVNDAFVDFTLSDGMPVGLAVIEIALDTVDPDALGPNFAGLTGNARIAIAFDAAPVPLPAGLVLFATGAAALGAARRS